MRQNSGLSRVFKLVNAVDDRTRMYWHVGRLRNRNDETVMVVAVLDLCMLAKRGP